MVHRKQGSDKCNKEMYVVGMKTFFVDISNLGRIFHSDQSLHLNGFGETFLVATF